VSQSLVLYRVEERVAVITLNRPEKMNAINREMLAQLDQYFAKVEEDSNVRAVVLEGEGRSFSAGADLASGEDPTDPLPWMRSYEQHYRRQFRIWDSGKIVIAGVHGYALGRGLELALWCDIVVASEDAKLGQPEIREGWLVHSVVPWLTGPQQAKMFMLSGDTISARDAERMGLVAKVVVAGAARSEAFRLAKRLAHVPPISAKAVKQMINGMYEQLGIRGQQAAGITLTAATSSMSPKDKGTEELVRVRREQGLKASLKFRDAPFES
jgi:enoyl-CoA hydratase